MRKMANRQINHIKMTRDKNEKNFRATEANQHSVPLLPNSLKAAIGTHTTVATTRAAKTLLIKY